MLFEYNRLPDTGSLMPSMSTGGASMNATMYAMVDTAINGNSSIPNHPMYNLLLVETMYATITGHQVNDVTV